jgi:iron complex outermembrane recepter protein
MKKCRLSAMALLCLGSATFVFAEKEDVPIIILNELIVTPTELNFDSPSTTSSRMALPVLQIPASIHILDNSKLKNDGYQEVSTAIEKMPGVTSGAPPGQPASFSMRGFTENQITILRDGLWLGPASMTGRPQNGFNLDRIELLKGPASVLHGQGAIAGTLNMITKQSTAVDSRSAELLTSYGRYNTLKLGTGIESPLGNNLWLRSDVSHYRSDGYVDNANPRSSNVTSSILWKPNNKLSMLFSFNYLKDKLQNYWGTPLVSGAFGTQPLRGVVKTTDGRTIDERTRFRNYNVNNEKANAHQYLTRIDTQFQPNESFSVRNSTYFLSANRKWQNAETYTFNSETSLIDRDRFFVSHDQDTVGNRIDFTFHNTLASRPNQTLVGVDFSYVDFKRRSRFFGNVDSVDPFSPNGGTFGDPDQTFLNPTKITTVAVFFEDTLKITQNLRLMAGLRHDHIKLDRDSFNLDGSFNSTNAFERSFNPNSWRMGAVYDINSSWVGYAQWSSGADPVGSNIFLVNGNQNFDLTNAQQWEVGMKSIFLDGRAEATLALYHIERENILVQTGSGRTVENAGNQRSKGVELEGAMRITRQWSVGANTAYTHAEFGDFGINSGKTPPNVPEWVTNAWARYQNIAGLPLEVGGNFRYVGDRFNNITNTVTLKSYELVDIQASYQKGSARFTARITNLFDKVYAYWGDTFYPDQVLLGSPRAFEISSQFNF